MSFHRYVALGDSFTEGVGDPDPDRPNGLRGWADRVAEVLGTTSDDFGYANLAIRGRKIDTIVGEQVVPPRVLDPDLVTVYAGANDILRPQVDLDSLVASYDEALGRLADRRRSWSSGRRSTRAGRRPSDCCGDGSRSTTSWRESRRPARRRHPRLLADARVPRPGLLGPRPVAHGSRRPPAHGDRRARPARRAPRPRGRSPSRRAARGAACATSSSGSADRRPRGYTVDSPAARRATASTRGTRRTSGSASICCTADVAQW